MTIDQLKTHKRILILGYGKEGHATEAFLRAFVPEVTIGVADQSQGPHYLSVQHDYDLVIKTPGIPKSAVTIPYTTATNIFFSNAACRIIGVTGSKGKSTTASLLHHVLEHAGKPSLLLGNIGQPSLEAFLDERDAQIVQDPSAYCILELSSYQLEDLEKAPSIGIITSLFPEHMNYHGSIDAYYAAKHRMITHMKSTDLFVYNPAFPKLVSWAHTASCRTLPYEIALPFDQSIIPLLGEHNRDNVRGVVTIAHELGISDDVIANAVSSFQPLAHRLQRVGTFHDITFYDDAISTTPESTIAALNAITHIDTIFLGGENRGYDFSTLVQVLQKKGIRNIVFFPESGAVIQKACEAIGYTPNSMMTRSMRDAVAFAYRYTAPNTVCLLSCASPSYSIWKNFEEKGDQFQKEVIEQGTEKTH